VLADKSLFAYHIEALVPSQPSNHMHTARTPQKLNGNKDVQFFSVGTLNGRTLVIYMKKKGVSNRKDFLWSLALIMPHSSTAFSVFSSPSLARSSRNRRHQAPSVASALDSIARSGLGSIACVNCIKDDWMLTTCTARLLLTVGSIRPHLPQSAHCNPVPKGL